MVRPLSKVHTPAWIQGAIIGDVLWAFALFCAYAIEANELSFPRWMEEMDLVDTIGSMFSLIAAPVAMGGWLMIWGDGPQPPAWLMSITFNICFAVLFYAILGGVIGLLFSKKWPNRFTALKLIIAVAIIISFIGMMPLLWERFN